MKSYSNNIVDTEQLTVMHDEQQAEIVSLRVRLDSLESKLRKTGISLYLLLVFSVVVDVTIIVHVFDLIV